MTALLNGKGTVFCSALLLGVKEVTALPMVLEELMLLVYLTPSCCVLLSRWSRIKNDVYHPSLHPWHNKYLRPGIALTHREVDFHHTTLLTSPPALLANIMAGILGKVDAKFAEILSDWNTATSVLLGLILIQILYPLFFSSDPDTHPMLLARQASFSPVRQKGQSATYRSNETPYGYPLKAGLNVKDPSMPKYVSGKDGDLRDVWRQAVRGVEGQNQRGALMTVLGSKQIIEHDLEEVSREINIIGHHLQEQRARRVAVYLPNSVELLSTVFAASFYGFTVILIPYKQQHDPVIDLLRQTNADTLVVAAGSLPLAEVAQKYKGLDQVVWVVEKTSRHVDWSEVPEGVGGSIAVSVWHDLVEDQKHVHGNDIPENGDTEPGNVVTVWQAQGGSLISVVEFSHKHLVAAIAAQISALPIRQRISHEDLFLPADSLTNSYTLTLTLAALFSNASVAVTSVAGPGVDLFLASRSVKPTIVVSSVESAQKLQANGTASLTGAMKQVIHWQQTRQILSSGSMPPHTPENSVCSSFPHVQRPESPDYHRRSCQI